MRLIMLRRCLRNVIVLRSGFGTFVLGDSKIKRQKQKIEEEITKWEKELEDPNITKVMADTRREWIRRIEERRELIKKLTHEI
jgi:hypothetical protein